MAESINYIIHPGEIETYVSYLEPTNIEELGSRRWFEIHERIQKLHQQSILEAGEMREETVKDTLISYGKIPVLVYEIICISVWKEKILPRLLSIEPNPGNTFMAYTILFHEASIIGLLETILYHTDSCVALEDSCVDLIDYCICSIVCLNTVKDFFPPAREILTKSNAEELKTQKKELAFEIGLRCISILRYIIENLDSLPISATSRVFETHDIPLLLLNLIETTPWQREDKDGTTIKYIDGSWKKVKDDDKMKLTRIEGIVWLTLRQLLLDPKFPTYYDMNEYRKQQLLKLQGYLHDVLVDQLSPLSELQYWLSHIAVSQVPPTGKKPLILEVLPQIRESLLRRSETQWKRIAQRQVKVLFHCKQGDMAEIAKRLSSAYDPETLEKLAGTAPTCAECGERAAKKCSRCKALWYCGRECQVKNWPTHKTTCNKLSESFQKLSVN
ncbi:zinc finger MYND domain-containing protein 10 [Schistocerca piceifrons]|uniref:zinc finger MYND domain-containing protein 10 n=1 Tax=Schistocerca piceifrons TaxID=274613 RepID=UPI001F5FB462|nr:zinc finger MYND domain-containing protein 10 [Schistocerca piceifrons]